MKFGISERIAESLVQSESITSEDKELYIYGLRQGAFMILNTLTSIAVGIVFGMVLQSLVFMVAYLPLRSFAGGYHAKTPLKCYLLSIILIASSLLVMRYSPWNNLICLLCLLCASEIIFWLAPVADFNKPLDQVEKVVYRKRTRIILSILVLLALVFWFIGCSFVSVSITVAIAMLAVMLLLGKAKDKVSMST